jgi:hypothetical protein
MYASVDVLHFVASDVHECDVDIEPTLRKKFFFPLFDSLPSPFLIHTFSDLTSRSLYIVRHVNVFPP